MLRTWALSSLLALTGAACADLTAPPAYVGSYVLGQVNGAPVPASVVSPRCTVTIANGQLHLEATTFALTLQTLALCTTITNGDTSISQVHGLWDMNGSAAPDGRNLTLVQIAPPGAVLPATLHLRAVPTGQQLELIWLDDITFPVGTRLALVRAVPGP